VNCWKPKGDQQPSLEYTLERFNDYLRGKVPLITGFSSKRRKQSAQLFALAKMKI
jgi:hypothetical protein